MVALQNVLLVLGTAIAAVIPRDATTILTDLEKIDSDMKILTSAVANWDGSTLGADTIQNDESILASDIKLAITHAEAVGSVSDSDASTLMNYLNGPLRSDVEAALSALDSRKTTFTSNGLDGVVKSDLRELKSLANAYARVVMGEAPTSQQAAAKAVLSRLDADFDSAIAFFS